MVDGRLRNGQIGFNRLTSRRNVCRYERFEWGRCTFRNASSDCRDGNNSRNTAHKLCCAAQYYSSRASTRNKSAAGMGLESIRAARVRFSPTRPLLPKRGGEEEAKIRLLAANRRIFQSI